jgi:hypothetical protein
MVYHTQMMVFIRLSRTHCAQIVVTEAGWAVRADTTVLSWFRDHKNSERPHRRELPIAGGQAGLKPALPRSH